ncbi:type-F conjugative transfer system pilin assembly protein TrbC [Pseudoduganella rivuli]|nr:type-F conjugative transfer system pilin assembly protein TrbC [Pseudoduganella rivuli]
MDLRTQLMIFVSFSMPEASLRRLGEQASKAGAVLILKGLNEGSLVKTAAAVHHLYGDQPAPFQIDPQAFSRFAVASVPTFVLIQPGAQWRECAGGYCLAPASYAKATGDVSLDYVLEHMTRTSTPIATSARNILRRLGR